MYIITYLVFNVLNNRVYGIYSNVITVHNSSSRPSVKGHFHAARVFGAPRGRRVELTL